MPARKDADLDACVNTSVVLDAKQRRNIFLALAILCKVCFYCRKAVYVEVCAYVGVLFFFKRNNWDVEPM